MIIDLLLQYRYYILPKELTDKVEGIYFIQDINGYIKIGESVDIGKRLKNYRTHNTHPVWICGYIPTTFGKENESFQHFVWGDFLAFGEWYAPGRALVEYVNLFCDGVGLAVEDMIKEPTNHSELRAIQLNESIQHSAYKMKIKNLDKLAESL